MLFSVNSSCNVLSESTISIADIKTEISSINICIENRKPTNEFVFIIILYITYTSGKNTVLTTPSFLDSYFLLKIMRFMVIN